MTIDHDTLVAYALGSLSPEEAQRVEAHLRAHPEDAAAVRAHLDALAALALGQEGEAVPEDAGAKLLERIRRESQHPEGEARLITLPRRRRWRPWAGLAAAAAIVAFAWVGVLGPAYQDLRIDRRLQAARAQPGALSEVLRSDANDPVGTLVRFADDRLLVVMDEAPARGRVYQGWEIADGAPASLGVFGGRVIEVGEPLAAGSVFGVTLEPPGGSPQPTTTPLVLYGL